jgi:hypothetical protein
MWGESVFRLEYPGANGSAAGCEARLRLAVWLKSQKGLPPVRASPFCADQAGGRTSGRAGLFSTSYGEAEPRLTSGGKADFSQLFTQRGLPALGAMENCRLLRNKNRQTQQKPPIEVP